MNWKGLASIVVFVAIIVGLVAFGYYDPSHLGNEPVAFATWWLVIVTVLVLGGVTVLLQRKAEEWTRRHAAATDEWNRNRATLEMANRWNDGELAEVRERFRRDYVPPGRGPLHFPADCVRKMGESDPKFRNDLHVLLNHLDIVAWGMHETNKLFHDKGIRHLYGGIITFYYSSFEQYIHEERMRPRDLLSSGTLGADTGRPEGERPEETWSYLDDLGTQLIEQAGMGKRPLGCLDAHPECERIPVPQNRHLAERRRAKQAR